MTILIDARRIRIAHDPRRPEHFRRRRRAVSHQPDDADHPPTSFIGTTSFFGRSSYFRCSYFCIRNIRPYRKPFWFHRRRPAPIAFGLYGKDDATQLRWRISMNTLSWTFFPNFLNYYYFSSIFFPSSLFFSFFFLIWNCFVLTYVFNCYYKSSINILYIYFNICFNVSVLFISEIVLAFSVLILW